MKRILQLFALSLFLAATANAQISITADDFAEQLEIGYQFTTYNDRNTSSVDIGTPGETSWNFTGLTANDEFPTESKAVGSSPYAADFPGAQYAVNYEGTFEGTYSNVWAHNSIGEFLISHGTGSASNTQAGEVTTLITFEDGLKEYKLPVQYEGTWDYAGTQTIATTFTIPGLGQQTNTIEQERTINYMVDGYGTVTMPGGKTLNALRIREENQLTGEGVDQFSVIYHILTKTGESVSITLADGETGNSGTVNIEAISWTSGDGDGVVIVDPINTPGTLTAAAGDNSITLNWVDLSDNEDGFRLERAVSGSGQFTQIAEVSANVTSYEDVNADAGVEYTYRVYAYNSETQSDYSNEVAATIQAVVTVNAPSSLFATEDGVKVMLEWTDNSDNELGFKIERSQPGTPEFTEIGMVDANVTTYNDADVERNITYTYRVYAYNNDAQSGYSNDALTLIPIPPIFTPSPLTAAAGDNSIILAWTDNSNNEDGFRIERTSNGPNEYSLIAEVAENVTSYEDATAEAGVEYTYRIYGYNDETESDFSNEATAMIELDIQINAPTSLTAVAGDTSITLEWSDDSDNELGFKVERKDNAASIFTEIGSVGSDVNTYEDVTAEAGVEYTYRVYGFNDDANSEFSNESSATILVTSLSELNGAPTEYVLNQNYPNPFNPSTTIQFAIPSSQHVSLKVYDVLGNEVAELVNGTLSPGSYSFNFDARNLSSGIYIYAIKSADFSSTKKMMLIK